MNTLDIARRVLNTEAAAIKALTERLDARFEAAIELLVACQGRVIVTGMGKSGIICRKIAATLSSTGTSAFFLHPAEAIHGDLGMVQPADVVIALSHSGETEELVRLLEAIRRIGAKLIALTGAKDSTLARAADVAIDCGIAEEACPMNLVPTASTTAALAMGDALAMTLLERKGFKEEEFARLHPGGKIGKRLLRVEAAMHTGDQIPVVTPATPMADVIHEMSSKRLGMTCVAGPGSALMGIVTDGDLRRHMTANQDLRTLTAAHVMTKQPATIARECLAVDALRIMEERRITSLVVVGVDDAVEGVVHLHDLWRTQMI
ncbi:MAG: KpsF/GutQ family sugar-phosphate isomerase [Acidobacteriota bacterium]|nr:KpsF/GutQ family sugar-phosphate isomerase [Acidobacteriota bacterium]